MAKAYGSVQEVTLPSGVTVKARRPSILSLIESGGFPQDMTLEVFKLLDKKKLDPEGITGDPEAVRSWARLINLFVGCVLVEPRAGEATDVKIVEVGDKRMLTGVIAIGDVLDGDKHILFLFGNDSFPGDDELKDNVRKSVERAEALARFRDGAEGDDAGHGGEAVRTETVGAGVLGPQEPAGA